MTASGDFELTMDELREVVRFVADSAQPVLAAFEDEHPDDPRPRAAIDAARLFVNGAARTKLQRSASMDAHRAAGGAHGESARLAARAAGDAASAAYLHPIAQASQVGHILRAAASAARIAELQSGDPAAAAQALDDAQRRASATVRTVLRRYPAAPASKGRVPELMATLDTALRADPTSAG